MPCLNIFFYYFCCKKNNIVFELFFAMRVIMQKEYPEVSAFDFKTQPLAIKAIERAWKFGNASYLLKVMKKAAMYRNGESDVG